MIVMIDVNDNASDNCDGDSSSSNSSRLVVMASVSPVQDRSNALVTRKGSNERRRLTECIHV